MIAGHAERPLEITDLLWPFDEHGRRVEVRRADVMQALAHRGQHRAAAIAAELPATDGVLDGDAVDRLGLRVHCELQRLAEELQFGRRVAHVLAAEIARLRSTGPLRTVTVVDAGCGLGYVVRWLAATGALGPDVDLVGVDLNPVLINAARVLAARKSLSCRFQVGDVVESIGTAERELTIVISSGMLHHLASDQLTAMFAGHQRLGVASFAHWDIAPCRWSTVGAWVFHRGRMREAVSRHDGVLSARRAHPAARLLRLATDACPAYAVTVDEGPRWRPRAIDVLRPVIGRRR